MEQWGVEGESRKVERKKKFEELHGEGEGEVGEKREREREREERYKDRDRDRERSREIGRKIETVE